MAKDTLPQAEAIPLAISHELTGVNAFLDCPAILEGKYKGLAMAWERMRRGRVPAYEECARAFFWDKLASLMACRPAVLTSHVMQLTGICEVAHRPAGSLLCSAVRNPS